VGSGGGAIEGALALRREGVEVVFLATHGPFGEDGTLQGFLETAGFAYTGSGVAGSALARDKIRAKRLAGAAGVRVADDVLVPPATAREAAERLGFPLVVKNPHEGSTLGIRFAEDERALRAAIEELSHDCATLLVERRIAGREVTAGVLESEEGEPCALPLVEIRPTGSAFDFAAKYTAGGAEELCPAPLPERAAAEIQATAVHLHGLFGLAGMSRSDFIVADDGRPYFLETNTIPGFTETSLLPRAAAAAGIGFRDLVTRLIEGALRLRGKG
jgi:D-alanine-D-alanine ligase